LVEGLCRRNGRLARKRRRGILAVEIPPQHAAERQQRNVAIGCGEQRPDFRTKQKAAVAADRI
jgi:hypothetical protein